MGHFGRRSGGVLLAALVGVLGGCGLPDRRAAPPQPPTALPAVDAADTFRFAASGREADVGRVASFGYEVYYRFSAVGPSTDRNLRTRAQLGARRFVRLAAADDRDPIDQGDRPLIEVSRAARVNDHGEVTLDFAPVRTGRDPQARWDRSAAALRRGVAKVDGTFEPFGCDRFQARHADVRALPQLASDCRQEQFQLQLYVLSYSRDLSGREQYSDARYLGSINLLFP